MWIPVFHLTVLAILSYAAWYDLMYVDLPIENEELKQLPLKSRILLLTLWCFYLQLIYYVITLLNDVFGTGARNPKNKPILRLIKDIMFSLSFPVAMFVFGGFWVIYMLDKDLIYPAGGEELCPKWLNHIMHTVVALFIFFEILFTHIDYPKRSVGLSIVTTFILSYFAWLSYIYTKTGTWLYPIFQILNWPLKIIFMGVVLTATIGFYLLGEYINNLAYLNTPMDTNDKWKKL